VTKPEVDCYVSVIIRSDDSMKWRWYVDVNIRDPAQRGAWMAPFDFVEEVLERQPSRPASRGPAREGATAFRDSTGPFLGVIETRRIVIR